MEVNITKVIKNIERKIVKLKGIDLVYSLVLLNSLNKYIEVANKRRQKRIV